MWRLAAGLALSVAIAAVAYRSRTLSATGVIGAVLVATACTAAGWSWAWLLIAFFMSATVLSKAGEPAKRRRTRETVEKGGNRDIWQVFANGGLFATLAIASLVAPSVAVHAAAAGALAASTADTWATEIGTLSPSLPRSIVSMRPVAPGTSGGVTLAGMIASLLGAGFVAVLAFLLRWPSITVCAAIAGGVGGAFIDSVLGATLQQKRWCKHCARGTERAVHTCGSKTIHASGIRWLNNDLVNFFSSIGGAVLGSLCLL